MNLFQQASAVTLMNLKSLRERAESSLVIVIGMAIVVGVMTSILSLAVGVSHSWDLVKRPGEVYVLSKTARFENQSSLTREKVVKIFDAPGLSRLADGTPAAVADFYFGVPLRMKATRRERSLMVRGTSERFFEYNPRYRVVEGRTFKAGLRELVVGKAARDAFDGVEIGSEIRLADGPWTVVGVYATDGGRTEWAAYGEADTLMAASRRATFNSVSAMLDGEEGLAAFRAALDADPTLDVRVWTTEEFWNTNVGPQVSQFQGIAYGVGAIMALGTLAAALSIMYATVSARLMEIATLRAIGFSASAVAVSVLVEALLLAGSGAVIGAAVAWGVFNNRIFSTSGTEGYYLALDLGVAAAAAVITLLVGSLAGLFPAIRAARLPVATALQVR